MSLLRFTYRCKDLNYSDIKVLRYGPVEMINDPSMTYKIIEEKLSLSTANVSHKKRKHEKMQAKPSVCTNAMQSKEILRQRHRQLWLNTRENYPNLSISQLEKKIPSAYGWLTKNDRQWHNNHKPPVRTLCKNWKLEDEKLLKLAKQAVISLLNYPDPIRITKRAILTELGISPQYHFKKLPHTKEYILSSIESLEAFTVRRVKRVVQQFVDEGKIPFDAQIYKQLNLRKWDWQPRIGNQIDEILSKISHVTQESNSYLLESAVTKEV
ncbi:MAG TPA: TnsD family Tn7-like transposition protein [Syntrophomonadaceae bacterium]|nr:TnsD family Tn7-like transposition protein [Syntrophomonadaceae bacterium]